MVVAADTRDAADPFAVWPDLQLPAPAAGRPDVLDPETAAEASAALAQLDDPRLVLSDGYVGLDRRRGGRLATLGRTTFSSRRTLLRLDILIVLALVALVAGVVVLLTAGTGPTGSPRSTFEAAPTRVDPLQARLLAPATSPVAATTPTATTAPPAAAPVTDAPAAAPVVAAAPAAVPGTPEAMGAAALALIRYPWQALPGYSIEFKPISDAPSPGFYGNTSFQWGQPGGTSTLYVFPGESVQQLAGITAFEIGHEVDAGYVEPQGGHDQIAALLGIHPASWAPECDCAEQGYLSGWYAAAFSDYWSPGVGDWSSLAPSPTGATLTALEPWLDPRVP